MGLSIHYSGYIFKKEMLDPLIDEVSEICKTLDWDSHVFEDDEIKGVSFAPKGSEPVFLTFNNAGRMLSPVSIIAKDIYDGVRFDKELMFTTSTKTQFAGIDAHISMIRLLKHLSKKYLRDFILKDEGSYWETGDEKILQQQFDNYNAAMDIFCKGLQDLPAISGESQESIVDRLEKLLRKRFGGN